ncbi:DGQHR domain-containing protein [Vibrio nigripulchritudo]|nr:DGQHR domain-containing protein [Vibrio nigripulchritudo]
MFRASEGFGPSFDCFEGIITIADFLNGFTREENSDTMSFEDKCQRDVSLGDSRVKGIYQYLSVPEKVTGFTGIIIFVNTAKVVEELMLGSQLAVVLEIPAFASRHVLDGQGRHAAFTKKLAALREQGNQTQIDLLLKRTLGLKFIVTNTPHVKDTRKVMRQFFSDVHLNLKKPPTTLSLFFSDDPLSRFMRSLSMSVSVSGKPLYERLVVHGKTERGHITDYSQLRSMVCKSIGSGPAKAAAFLADEQAYSAWLTILTKLVSAAYSNIDAGQLDSDDWSEAHSKALFTKALFTTALGMSIRALIQHSAMSNTKVNYARFSSLAALPLDDLSDPLWINAGVSQKDDQGKVTIIPKCSHSILAILCDSLDLAHSTTEKGAPKNA